MGWVRRTDRSAFHECTLPDDGGALGDLARCDECRSLWRVARACDWCDRYGGHYNGAGGMCTVGWMWRPATLWQSIRYRRNR